MADMETGLNIPVGAYADEDSAKKAIQDLTKSVLGALKDGYIEIPTAISDKFDKSKASTELLRAQQDFIDQWKKMSDEGFSSSEKDLDDFVKKFTKFKSLMGKQGKSGSKQNLAIRDIGLGELVQSYKKQLSSIQAQTKNKNQTRTTRRSTTLDLPSDEEIKADIEKENKRNKKANDKFIKSLTQGASRAKASSPGTPTNLGTRSPAINGPAVTPESILASEISPYGRTDQKTLMKNIKEELKKTFASTVTRKMTSDDYSVFEDNKGKKTTKSDYDKFIQNKDLYDLAKIQGGLIQGRDDVTSGDLIDQIALIMTRAFSRINEIRDKVPISDYSEYASKELEKTYQSISTMLDNRFSDDSKRRLGSTSGEEKGSGPYLKEVNEIKKGIFETLDRIWNEFQTSMQQVQNLSENVGIDRSVYQQNRRQTEMSDTYQQMRRALSPVVDTLQNTERLNMIEASREGAMDAKALETAQSDASTGLNTETNAKELFSHQISGNRISDQTQKIIQDISNKLTNGYVPTDINGNISQTTITGGLSQILQDIGKNVSDISKNVSAIASGKKGSRKKSSTDKKLEQTLNTLPSLVPPGNKLPSIIPEDAYMNKLPDLFRSFVNGKWTTAGVIDRSPQIPTAPRDITDWDALMRRQQASRIEQDREQAIRRNAELKQANATLIPNTQVYSSQYGGFLGKLERTIKQAMAPSEADRIMNANAAEQERMRAERINRFGLNNGRQLTDTGDIAGVRRTKELFGWVYRSDKDNKELFQDIKLSSGLGNIDTTDIMRRLNQVLSGPEMFRAQTGGTLRNLIGSMTGYIGMPSIEKTRAEAEGLNQVMANVRNEVSSLLQAIKSDEATLRGMQREGTVAFDNSGQMVSGTSAARKTFADMEERKGVLRAALAEVGAIDQVVSSTGGKVRDIIKNLGFVMPELMQNNTILQNLNAGLDKNGKALKFQTRFAENLNYTFQLMARHVGQVFKNWMLQLNPLYQIRRLFTDFASYDVKWQRTMNVIKYNLRRIVKPFMEWLAQQLVNLIGLVNSLLKGIGSVFGQNWDLFDQSAANAEKMNEELQEAASVSAGFDELHDISSSSSDDENSADNLLGDIYTPQWDGLNKVLEDIGKTIGNIVKAVSDWNFWDWLILAGAALAGYLVLKWLINLFSNKNPLQAVANGFSFLEKAVGWALLIWAFTEFTKALTDFVECMKSADWDDIAKSLVMLGGAFAELVAGITGVQGLTKLFGTSTGQLFGLAALVGVFDLFVAALIPFIETIRDLGDEKIEVIASSLMTLASAFIALIGGVAGVEGITKLIGLDWTSLLGLAAVVGVLDLFVAALVPFINAISQISDGQMIDTVVGTISSLVGAFLALAAGVGVISRAFKGMDWSSIGQFAVLAAVFDLFMLTLIPFINSIKDVPWETLAGGAVLIAGAFLSLGGAIAILGTAFKGMPLSAFAELLVLLVAFGAIIWVLKEFVTAMQGLTSEQMLSGLALLAGAIVAVSVALGLLAVVFTAVVTTGIGAVALLLLALLLGVFTAIIYALSDFVKSLGEAGEGIKAIFEGVATVIDSISNGIVNTITAIGTVIMGIVETIANAITTVLEPILGFVDSVIGKITELASTIAHEIGETIRTVIKTTGDVIIGIIDSLLGAIPRLLNSILNFVGGIGPAIERSADSIMNTVTKFINFTISAIEYLVNLVISGVNSIIGAINSLSQYVGITIPTIPEVSIRRFVPQYEQGTNYVPNDGLAYLHQGEAVIPKKYNQPYQPTMSTADQATMYQIMSTLRSLDNTMKQGIPVNGRFVQRGSDLVAVVNKTKSRTGADLLSNVAYAR